jgi:Zn finger protein HypA/HybF involved in hydrogenase expression
MPRLHERELVRVRYCNKCNKRLEDRIVDEPECKKCGCPEFRLKTGKLKWP